MKKVLVVFLALAVLLSLSSIAFSYDRGSYDRFKRDTRATGATVNSDIDKEIEQETEAEADGGYAHADANNAMNFVNSSTEAKALDADSTSTNNSWVGAQNVGEAASVSGGATAANAATNSDCEIITDVAESTVVCDFDTEIDGNNNCLPVAGFSDGDGDNRCDKCGKEKDLCECCECCPAEVKGDIDIDIEQETEAKAESGDATAFGNTASNVICSNSKSIADDGGSASNISTIGVINGGTATATSGAASASNVVNNSVCIDILRSAITSKTITISKFLSF